MAEFAIEPAEAGEAHAGERTGRLSRSLGLGSVIIFSIASVSLAYGGAFPYSSAPGLWPGADLFGIITCAVVIGLLFAYIYSAIGSAIPRFGADYYVASRVLPPPVAFASSWTMVMFFGLLSGSMVASIPAQWLPIFLRLLSTLMGREELLAIIPWISSQNGIATIGTAGVVMMFLAMVMPPKVTRQALAIGLALTLASWYAMYYQFGLSTPGSFPAAWDGLFGAGSYLDHMLRARQDGMLLDYGVNSTLMAGMSLGLWIVFGHTNVIMFAREIKNPSKNLFRGISLSLLIIWLTLGIGALLVQRVVPLEWLSAESFLFHAGAADAQPWVMVYAAVLNPNPFILGLIAIAWAFSLMNLAHTLIYTASREIIAWAEDQIIPKDVAFVHPTLSSPLIALLLVSILAVFGVVDASLNGDLLIRYNPLFMMAFVLFIPTLAISLMPFLRRDLFEKAPAFVRASIGPLPLITLGGFLAVFYLGWVVRVNAVRQIFGGIGGPTFTIFAILFGMGVLWFIGRMALLHSRGVDISRLFKGIPEE